MGIFAVIFSSILLLLFMGANLSFQTNNLQTENQIKKFLTDDTIQIETNKEEKRKLEDSERALIRTCQTGQSWVLICKQCYANGYTNCPYPTDSFCQSAKTVDTTDMLTFWKFLPNANGVFSDIKNGTKTNKNNLTNISQLASALRGELSNIYDFSNNKNYHYERPSGSATDVCAVSGVVSN